MSLNTEQLERLITRRLDGEITDVERRILDRELAESAEARQLFDEYRGMDVRAHAAIQAVCEPPPATLPFRQDQAGQNQNQRSTSRRSIWLKAIPGLLAAAAAVAFFVTPTRRIANDAPVVVTPQAKPPLDIVAHDPRKAYDPHLSPLEQANRIADGGNAQLIDYVERPAIQPRNRRQSQTRDWIGIMNEKGDQVYLLEQNHRRTRIVPVKSDF